MAVEVQAINYDNLGKDLEMQELEVLCHFLAYISINTQSISTQLFFYRSRHTSLNLINILQIVYYSVCNTRSANVH